MPLFGNLFNTPQDNLRIIITRHGERTDFLLGPGWTAKARRYRGRDLGISHLTPRANFEDWESDTPLTTRGERQSLYTGHKLLKMGYPIDFCYSSPAYRSIQTANKILQGQGRKAVPINIEPGLFECPRWYHGLPISFVPPEDLAQDRYFNINPSYSPLFNGIDPDEDANGYYLRSRRLIDAITKAHKHQGGTILLSGHAGSIETLARGARNSSGRTERLLAEAEKVNYCNFAILERDAATGKWSIHVPHSHHNSRGGPIAIQSSIPLYRVSTNAFYSTHFNESFPTENLYDQARLRHRFRVRPRRVTLLYR